MPWLQRLIELAPRPRGLHLVTGDVLAALPELLSMQVGLLHVFCCHTSAGLTLNENADRDVRLDLADALDRLAPRQAGYRHDCEGPDDMPAHVQTSLVGSNLTIPIHEGRLALGTWQGIYLCEFRNQGGMRQLMLTAQYDVRADG